MCDSRAGLNFEQLWNKMVSAGTPTLPLSEEFGHIS